MKYLIGIDAGSKTLKVVTLDEEGKLVHSVYRRHRANIRETMREVLHDLVWRYGDIEGSIAITGSAGIELADLLGLPFVQEVVATTHAVQTFISDADAIIELGGEDAKVVYLTGGLEQRMNATCAGGTGGFIDTIAFIVGVRSKEMSSLAMGANRLYPIASRCAVFAQTDVRPLLNSGAKKADIAASALEAVVKQTLSGLACGRPIRGKVVFLGGPLEHIPDLVFRFRRALDLTHKTGVKPTNAHLFTAMGAALLGPELLVRQGLEASYSLAELEQLLAQAPVSVNDLPTLPPLFENETERDEFMGRHHTTKLHRERLSDCKGPLFLGIDAGSTTIKFAVVDEQRTLVYSDYRPTKGDTLQTASLMLEELFRLLPHEYSGKLLAWISHATVTGYGEGLLKAAFRADSGVVETVAHLRATQHLYPKANFILDIGGQDMKALWIRHGVIENAVLNEACSSGCGSFIEGTAYSLRLNPYTFADIALTSETPVDLGMKCTVFMTSRVRHAQKIGIPYEDIAAGLAYSVVKNALFKIIGMRNIDELGDTVVVQGGAFMSDAVLRAFELVSEKQVIRPDIAHLMGAYGAAITAASRFDGSPSSLISRTELEELKPLRRTQRCTGCTNDCLLSIIDFGSGRFYVNGNRCDRALDFIQGKGERAFAMEYGTGKTSIALHKDRAPNLYELEQKLLSRYGRRDKALLSNSQRQTFYIGIPRTLNLYENLPFWYTLLSRLGFSVVLPSSTIEEDNRDGSRTSNFAGTSCATLSSEAQGLETVPSESVCFPAKITHIHCAELIHADVDAIFMPIFERGSRCPVSSQYGSILGGNIPEIASGKIALIAPKLQAIRPRKIGQNLADAQVLLDALNSIDCQTISITADELNKALDAALAEQISFEKILARATEKALQWVDAPGRRGIILASRPYHVARSLSHGIDTLLADLGFAVFTRIGLHSSSALSPLDREHPTGSILENSWENSWKPAKSLIELARYTSTQTHIDLICLYSFGCGFDALSLAPAKELMEEAGKIFTAFKIDEIVDLAHIRIRLRTLAETLRDQSMLEAPDKQPEDLHAPSLKRGTLEEMETGSKLPQKTARLRQLTLDDIECARKFVTHDICFVTSAIAGAAINLLDMEPDITHLTIPYVCSSCLLDDLPNLISEALGWTPEIVWETTWEQPLLPENTGIYPEETPRIGILGNVFLCFDEHANHHVTRLIEELGCTPVLPEADALFTDDVRYLDEIESFLEDGVKDIVYLQAFGCLKGHIGSRGALRDLQKRFPDLRLTIVDYDHDVSTLNQENRIRLALAEAYRRARR